MPKRIDYRTNYIKIGVKPQSFEIHYNSIRLDLKQAVLIFLITHFSDDVQSPIWCPQNSLQSVGMVGNKNKLQAPYKKVVLPTFNSIDQSLQKQYLASQ